MNTSVTAPPQLLTSEEFIQRYDEEPVELDKGLVVETNMPSLQHGLVCANFARHLGNFVEERQFGRVMSNDSWIRTRRTPDSVRGPDVLYISYERLPKGPMPAGLLDCVPEFIAEVRSASDTWKKMLNKSSEYLNAGVKIVLILDPDKAAATIFRGEELPQTLHNGDSITLPDLLPGFSVTLAKVFG